MAATKRPSTRTVSLDGFYNHSGWMDCLLLVQREIIRTERPDERLPPSQQTLFSDLWSPFDEEGLAGMLEYWKFDPNELLRRGRGYEPGVPAKPRVDVYLEVSSAGNLKVSWFPRNWSGFDPTVGLNRTCDFLQFREVQHRSQGFDSRPSNELMFVHGVGHALIWLSDEDQRPGSTIPLNMVLLQACQQAVEMLKSRLKEHFDVRMLKDIFIGWADRQSDDPMNWRDTPARMVSWVIDSPQDRQSAAERAALVNSEQEFGFPLASLLEIWRDEFARQLAPYTLPDRIVRTLKKQGHSGATRGRVTSVIELLERYRPQDCPTASASSPQEKVGLRLVNP